MPAPLGNKFWQQRSSHGRKPIFADAEAFWEACCEYFDWVESNPLSEDSLVTYQGAATHEPIAKMRAMTITGLCIFLDISIQAWYEYSKREGFVEVASRVDDIIRTQKFEGASAGLLNPNIIARDLGLSDKTEHSGPAGGPIEVAAASSMRRRAALALLLARKDATAE